MEGKGWGIRKGTGEKKEVSKTETKIRNKEQVAFHFKSEKEYKG